MVALETQENFGPKRERLGLRDDQIRPVEMKPGFDGSILESARRRACDDTPGLGPDERPYGPAQVQSVLVRECSFRFEIYVDEETKPFGLLFDDVQFTAPCQVLEISPPKRVEIGIGDDELTSVHENVRRLGLLVRPFLYHYTKGGVFL